jgi:m7GpppX diphosphatase
MRVYSKLIRIIDHLHVHIVHIQHEQFSGMVVGQAHLLEDVIDAIRLESGYFEKRVFTYPLGEQHPLYALLEEAGAMQTHDDNML